MVITDLAQFELLVQEVRDQILSESQGVGEVDIVDNLDSIYSLPALKLNDSGDQVVEAPLSLLSAPAEEAAALARAAAYDANTAAESANSAASSANLATDKTNEAISNAQSATQRAESSADKANTAAQNADEATAQVLSGESERVEAENARQAAETERQSAEEERKSAEEARKLAEQSREEAETSRVSAEESRVTAESERVTAESNRVQAETERALKESERESAESTRQLNETARQSNEDTRVQLEQTRLTNEEQRVSAESSRETEYTDLKQRADALIDDNEAAIENANTAAENANAAIANMENTYARKDEIPDVSEFITTSVDNLVNYYRKSETYNLELINSLIGSITTINFKIVDSLPETGENNLIYLVPSSKQEEKNVKDEYIWVDGSWELIGSTKIDLSNYYTRDEVNSTFALKTELAWDTITGKPVWIGSSKPTYTWSEINEKPTTLAGYGITDAYIKNGTIVLGSNNITPLTSSNYTGTLDGRYVKKSGDTMTGRLIISAPSNNLFTMNSSGEGTDSYPYFELQHNGIRQGVYGANGNQPYFYNDGWRKMWYEGNDGSGSGLDADTLDGKHFSTISENGYILEGYTIDATGLDENTYYPVLINVNRLFTVRIECHVSLNSNSKPSWSTHAAGFTVHKIWEVNGSCWGISIINRRVHVSDYYWATSDPVRGIGQLGNSSNEYVYVRGGGRYYFYISHNCTPLLVTSSYTNKDQTISPTTSVPDAIKRNVAFDTDNVASATKLQTPRTIWGRSFDGTLNVSGDLSGVGHIYTNNSNGCYNMYAGFAEGESLRIDAKTGDSAWSANGIVMLTNGYIGFGTISPLYKVDVTGDIRATGNIIGTVSSDIQLKTILNTIDYQDKLLSLGDVVEYEYNEIAFDRPDSSTLLHRTYTGLVYLNVKDILPSMAYEDSDGYGCLNYLSYDYINLIAGALQQTITKLKQLEKRISILEEENINLKLQLSN